MNKACAVRLELWSPAPLALPFSIFYSSLIRHGIGKIPAYSFPYITSANRNRVSRADLGAVTDRSEMRRGTPYKVEDALLELLCGEMENENGVQKAGDVGTEGAVQALFALAIYSVELTILQDLSLSYMWHRNTFQTSAISRPNVSWLLQTLKSFFE